MEDKCCYKIQLWCLALLILVLESQGRCSLNSEGKVLLEFRSGVYLDRYRAFANWNSSDCDPCLWFGVQCVDNEVRTLDLRGFSLEGVIASDLGKLTRLTILKLSDNRFFGSIPKEFGDLKKLELLDLSNNNLSGSIPAEIGDMHSLKHLLICNNKLQGSFPVELQKLKFLSELRFDENILPGVTQVGCINRKLGQCLWQKSESLISPFKAALAYYLNLLKVLVKDCSESTIIPLEGTFSRFFSQFSLFKFRKISLDSFADYLSSHIPMNELKNVQTVEEKGRIVRRRLQETYDSALIIPTNLLAAPPNIIDDTMIEVPSSRSSGSYSAVQTPPNLAPSPSPVPNVSSHIPKSQHPAGESESVRWKYVIGFSIGSFLLLSTVIILLVCRTRAAKNIAPWKTGLSGQLQKAFVTGVPKLKRTELEMACEDFSNIIDTQESCILYKGTLSSGVEIAVISTTVSSIKDWSKRAERAFQKKIDTLSRVNHKNFVNLLGYCDEDVPFARMMVFEYAPNGSLFEHLHVKEAERIDWFGRIRIIMGIAYCLQYMHELNPPARPSNLNSSSICLTDDYAAKIMENSFWQELSRKSKISGDCDSEHSVSRTLGGTNIDVYNFAILCLEIISGRLSYSEENGSLIHWAKDYLNDKQKLGSMVDPTLKSYKDTELEILCEIIEECTHFEGGKRPTMKEIITKLRSVIDIFPEHATPRLSPLWWAELEILSAEAP